MLGTYTHLHLIILKHFLFSAFCVKVANKVMTKVFVGLM